VAISALVTQIAQRYIGDGFEQLAPLGAFQHPRLAGLHDVLGPAHRRRRIVRHDLADHQPVEHHAHGGELLFTVPCSQPEIASGLLLIWLLRGNLA
jgi:hypothetical protein